MDFGGNDRRRTKGDLKRKRLARGYKRGGQFRTANVNETSETKEEGTTNKKKTRKSKGKKGRKY